MLYLKSTVMKKHIEIESYHAFQVPKADGNSTYCEDAYFPNENTVHTRINGRCYIAVADGVSETSYAKEWANQLTEHFSEFDPETIFADWVKTQQNQFNEALDKKIKEKEKAGTLPWYVYDKVAAGAAATFAGLILDLENNTFHCFAVGDAIVIITKPNQAPVAWPINDPKDFDNTPNQINSKHTKAEYIEKIDHRLTFPTTHQKLQNNILTGDETFLLMTDALAAWTLQDPVRNITELLNLSTNEAFAAWVKQHRGSKVLKNDDTTLCIIKLKKNAGDNTNSSITTDDTSVKKSNKDDTGAKTDDTSVKKSNKDDTGGKTDDTSVKKSDKDVAVAKTEDTSVKKSDKDAAVAKTDDTSVKKSNKDDTGGKIITATENTQLKSSKQGTYIQKIIDKYKFRIYLIAVIQLIIIIILIIIILIYDSNKASSGENQSPTPKTQDSSGKVSPVKKSLQE